MSASDSIDLDRLREWVGRRATVHEMVHASPARALATVRSVELKIGQSGPLVFVTVGHEFEGLLGMQASAAFQPQPKDIE